MVRAAERASSSCSGLKLIAATAGGAAAVALGDAGQVVAARSCFRD